MIVCALDATPDPSGSNRKSQFSKFTGELTLKVVEVSQIGTTYPEIDFGDCSSKDVGAHPRSDARQLQKSIFQIGELTLKVVEVSQIGTTYREIDLGDCFSKDLGRSAPLNPKS